jgi:hypothetical protein
LALQLHEGAVATYRYHYLIIGLAEEMKCLEELVMLAKEGVRSAFLKNLVAHIPTINIIRVTVNIIKVAVKLFRM